MKPLKQQRTQRRKGLLTVPEVAAEVRVSRITAWRWAKSGKLRAYQMGKAWRIYRTDLEAFIRKASNREKQEQE